MILPTAKKDPRILSHNAIRRAIGALGFVFPLGLLAYTLVKLPDLQPSISHFYYTEMGDVLVGVLIAIGVFLWSYQGYDEPPSWPKWLPGDRWTARAAGTGAIGVALFPTDPLSLRSLCETTQVVAPCNIADQATLLNAQDLVTGLAIDVSDLHAASAILFFVAIFWFCVALFPLGPRGKPERRMELVAYYVCAAVIVASLVALWRLLGGVDNTSGPAVFWWETVAVWAFSVAWLINGEILGKVPGFRVETDENGVQVAA